MSKFNFADLEKDKKPNDLKPPKSPKRSIETDNGKTSEKKTIKPQHSSVSSQYINIKIPENIDNIGIAKLRTLYSDIFGKEPPHDKTHGKEWVTNKINFFFS